MVARELGMTLREYIERVTHREHLTWLAWLEMQWDQPNRSDHYLMQIAAAITRGQVKRPESVQLKHCKLSFAGAKKQRRGQSVEDSKAFVGAWLGIKIPIDKEATGQGEF